MNAITICPECGAQQPEGNTCLDDFYQMLYWEAEDMALGRVHHLMVLCYHLQHASLYSPEGLQHGRWLLKSFVVDGVSPSEMRQTQKETVNSGKRKWKIKGNVTPGAWEKPVQWTMTAADVVAGGMAGYCDNVELWAKSVYDSLKAVFGD